MDKNTSRTKNSILNIVFTSSASIISLLISFANRFIFLKVLDATYLGVSGLFSNITLIFSLVELGMGNALTQMFYKPFAEKDYKHLSQVTHTTKVLLNAVGLIIILLTIAFTPFLQFFVNDINAVPNMRLIFFLYGVSSSVTYFLGFYRTIITANQQAYKLVKIDVLWKIITLVAQAAALIVSRNFIVYLIVQILLNFTLNIIIKKYVQRQIPEIDYRSKEFVPMEESKTLMKNVAGLSLNKVGSIVTNGTDNILISKFLNLIAVGLSSNYVMIQQAVTGIVESVFSPLLASIGNLCVSEDEDTKYDYFNRFSFASFWIYGFCSLTAFALSDIFISFVFGDNLTIPRMASFFMMLDIFCSGLFRVATLFRTAEGLFWYGKFRPLLQAVVNLAVSLVLVMITHELWAIYAGTVASRVLITIWYEPLIVLKYALKKKPWKYYLRLLCYVVVFAVSSLLTVFAINLLPFTGLLQLIVAAAICVVLINGIFVCVFFHTKEFKYWIGFIKGLKGRLRRK